ncbi:MAG: bifunctional oligoribonuclease/PAP phosphatase NrnA [Bacilli bacterium]|nr:bifunctional oligoribonuclease/PAP phosphatase NrnA [Bacilli bacterium]
MFFKQNIYNKIYKKIKKANTIVIARHVGPDPDALGSSLGLKQIIEDSFNNKKVYVIGNPAAKFSYLGNLDKIPENLNNDEALLIVTDTPDRKRVDGVDPLNFKNSIKIDHHPFIEKTCTLEWIDDKASSASQMILELVFNTNLKLTKQSAEKLYTGIVADTNRFMFAYTSPKTFKLVSEMLEKVKIDITKVYDNLYIRNYKEIKFQGYLSENFNITENNVGYIVIKDEDLKKYNVDPATPGNMINNFNHINEMLVWLTATEDKDMGSFRISVRSRGPIINETVSIHGGGGHIYASGTRLKTEEEIESLIQDLDKTVKEYKEKTLEN